MIELLLKSLIISLACVGLRISSDKGMILYFLRWPYDWLVKRSDNIHRRLKSAKEEELYLNVSKPNIQKAPINKVNDYHDKFVKNEADLVYWKARFKHKWLIYILKPVIGCITCMASVYVILMELSFWHLSWWTIPNVFIVATLNSIIFGAYNKLTD